MENIDEEIRKAEQQKENLRFAERMARFDELTGVKNQKAFTEETRIMDVKIKSDMDTPNFGVVMCDVNDLKRINDTRGHSFGDEAIQRTSHLICEFFKHSPVFRIGGDEFAVILTGCDLENRETLIKKLKEESLANQRSRSGPTVACGMAVYDRDSDSQFSDVFERADSIWLDYVHPDDVTVYKEAVEAVLCGNAEVRPICYRARKADGKYVLLATRGFVLSDREGNPEYFGGIIIPQ